MQYIKDLTDFLEKLESNSIFYKLDKIREDSIMIYIVVPGERWEVEFVSYDGKEFVVEIERFTSDGNIKNEEELELLFDLFSD